MNVDPLRPPDTDTEHEWWVSEFEQHRIERRRRQQQRRETTWAMLLCFVSIVCLAVAAIVFGQPR